jgi:hypothetical protein
MFVGFTQDKALPAGSTPMGALMIDKHAGCISSRTIHANDALLAWQVPQSSDRMHTPFFSSNPPRGAA